jgi:hypothetical protein
MLDRGEAVAVDMRDAMEVAQKRKGAGRPHHPSSAMSKVHNLGGFRDWVEARLPAERSSPRHVFVI